MKPMEYGKITDEAITAFEKRVGMELRVTHQFNDEATKETIKRFADGIGDSNPLWLNQNYAVNSPYQGLVAPPSWLASVFPTWILQGLPGVHAIHVETKWEFYRPVLAGDVIRPESYFTGYETKQCHFGGKTVVEHQEARYYNQKNQLVGIAKPTGFRMEREAMIELNQQGDLILPHPWTKGELAKIEDDVLNEKERGNSPLFWEDVNVGDQLPAITKGPVGITDMIAYCIGASPVAIKAHGSALNEYQKHPDWCFRDPMSQSLEPIYSVHYNQNAASSCGLPYPYDVGTQRHCWLMHLLTNWMGDYGWIRTCNAKYTGFVYFSDAVRLTGEVTKKYIGDTGELLVEVRTNCINQRGKNVMPGLAVIELPTSLNKNQVIDKILSEKNKPQ